MSEELKEVKGLHIGDRIQGITFDALRIEKEDRFVANRRELVVTELVDETSIKFSPAEDKSEGFIFNFKGDDLNKFYQANETTFTGLFTDMNMFQPALHEVYTSKLCPKLNEMMDKFAQRAVSESEIPSEETKNETAQ